MESSHSPAAGAAPAVSIVVRPTDPVAPWQGGKRLLSSTIVPIIDRISCDTYAEPFIGMGGIFLRRRRRPRLEVINDLSGDVATLFRVLREHGPEFIAYLQRWWVTSRDEFNRLLAIDPDRARLTDFNRAARFLYLQRMTFGGKVRGQTFGVSPGVAGRFNVSSLEPMLVAVHKRLAGVVIEQLSYSEMIRRYDRPATLFYLDPPYWGCEDDYGVAMFARHDFERLAGQLRSIAGRFILSLNDTPGVREVFSGFTMREVRTTYTMASAGAGKRVGELLISNMALPE